LPKQSAAARYGLPARVYIKRLVLANISAQSAHIWGQSSTGTFNSGGAFRIAIKGMPFPAKILKFWPTLSTKIFNFCGALKNDRGGMAIKGQALHSKRVSHCHSGGGGSRDLGIRRLAITFK
jgi:hypothetical protein